MVIGLESVEYSQCTFAHGKKRRRCDKLPAEHTPASYCPTPLPPKELSRNTHTGCSSWIGWISISRHDDIARTTGEKRGVTRFTKGRLLGSTHNHDSSSCCFKNQVDNRKTGSVARIATESSLAVNDRANHPSLFAARTPWILATGTSGKVNGDSCELSLMIASLCPSSGSNALNTLRTSEAGALCLLPVFFLKTEKNPAWRIPWQLIPSLGINSDESERKGFDPMLKTQNKHNKTKRIENVIQATQTTLLFLNTLASGTMREWAGVNLAPVLCKVKQHILQDKVLSIPRTCIEPNNDVSTHLKSNPSSHRWK